MTQSGAADTAPADYLSWLALAEAHMAAKAKPVGSLGVLESLGCRLAALQQTLCPSVGRASLLVFAADHGMSAARPEISAFPRAVSAPVFRAVVRGQAASAVLCAVNDCAALLAVDVGLAADVTDARPPPRAMTAGAAAGQGSGSGSGQQGTHIEVLHRKVRPDGSRNMLEGPAMSEDELHMAMRVGAEAVVAAIRGGHAAAPADAGVDTGPVWRSSAGGDAADGGAAGPPQWGEAGPDAGCDRSCAADGSAWPDDWRRCVICLGEVGIGNTTAAAALLAALTGAAPEDVCGRGTGVDDAGLAAKRAAVAEALRVNSALIESGGPLGALRAVGGLELAAMAGAVFEAARLGLPVVVDGFICGAAVLAALRLDPEAVGRVLILSHRSSEHGASLLLAALRDARPLAPSASRHPAAHAAGQYEDTRGADRCGADRGTGGQGAVEDGDGVAGVADAAESACEGAGGARGATAVPTPAVLDMGLRLGEGTGAVLMLPLLRSAAAIMALMASLQEVLAG